MVMQQHQQGAISFIGKGKLTETHLHSEKSFTTKMEKLGHDPKLVQFILRTSAPKNHQEYLPKGKAAKLFFPEISTQAVQLMASKALTEGVDGNGLICQLIYGIMNDEYLETRPEKATKPQSTRQRKSVEDKAEKLARAILDAEFRSLNGLPVKGKISEEMIVKKVEFRNNHLQDKIKEMVTELQNKPRKTKAAMLATA